MTITKVKAWYEGEYADVEVYNPGSTGRHYPLAFHTDNCSYLEDAPENAEVGLYELMNEYDYNHSIMANTCDQCDFKELYGDSNARVLCIMLKETKYEREVRL